MTRRRFLRVLGACLMVVVCGSGVPGRWFPDLPVLASLVPGTRARWILSRILDERGGWIWLGMSALGMVGWLFRLRRSGRSNREAIVRLIRLRIAGEYEREELRTVAGVGLTRSEAVLCLLAVHRG